jgi:hypothetical protein
LETSGTIARDVGVPSVQTTTLSNRLARGDSTFGPTSSSGTPTVRMASSAMLPRTASTRPEWPCVDMHTSGSIASARITFRPLTNERSEMTITSAPEIPASVAASAR